MTKMDQLKRSTAPYSFLMFTSEHETAKQDSSMLFLSNTLVNTSI